MSKPRVCEVCAEGGCSWIFSGLEGEGLARLRALMRPIAYGKGELIFQEGAPAFGLYIICQGKVKLAKHAGNGKRRILKLIGPGEILGEESLFGDGVYAAYAKTLEETWARFMGKADFLPFILRYPSVALKLIEKLARELKGFQSKLMEASYESCKGKVARLLLSIAESYGVEERGRLILGLELSRADLAAMAGISTETAIRILSELREENLLALDGQKIIILKKHKLQELAEPFPVTLKENLL